MSHQPRNDRRHRRLRIEPLEDRRLLAVIGLDFGNGDGIAPTQTAGVVPRVNWNNLATGATGAVNNLVNDANVATTLDVSWNSNNTWQVAGGTAANGNAAIYKGYLDTTTTSTTTVTVSQIPFALYDVYVYFDGDAADGRSGNYAIDTSNLPAVTQGPYRDTANWPIVAGGGAFVLADAPNEAGNYAVFAGLSGASFVLTATPTGGANPRAPLNAVQIVERTLTVDTNTDVVDGNYAAGQFSLRETIALANARPGADTISFAPGMSGQTITLGGTELVVTDVLTIDAAPLAANVTVDANLLSRVMNITTASGDFMLAGLNLTRGRITNIAADGGAIRSLTSGLLILTESTVSVSSVTGSGDADGGGIYAQGAVTLNQSTLSGNSSTNGRGGGIYALGNVTLNQSTVDGNTANNRGGGGVYAVGAAMLQQSTVSGNTSNLAGGGIYAIGAVTIVQSTVTANNATGSLTVGGGVFQFDFPDNAPLTVTGSILSGNAAAGGGADVVSDPGATLTVNDSLIGTTVTPTAGANNVVTNTPLLGPLADNGGPTKTHALLAGSPALNAGNPAVVFSATEFDQRGAPFLRVFGGRVDIGAFEQFGPYVVDTNTDVIDGNYAAGQFSLREAIVLTNARPGADTITFASSMSGQTITLGGSALFISDALTIDAAPLAQNVTIDADLRSEVMTLITSGGDVTLARLNLTRGRALSDGGAVYSTGTGRLTLTESTVSGNSSAYLGGGIYAGLVTLVQSTVSDNTSSSSGGGIFASGSVTLHQSTVSDNNSGGFGGGIFTDGSVALHQSTISGNNSSLDGGGIYADLGVTITQSTITNNQADFGGGVFQFDSAENRPLTISGSILAGNTATNGSPDLRPDPQSPLTVNNSLIGNTAGSGVTATTGSGNLLNQNALLGPLADNGGPTKTHALLAGSPAIDAGSLTGRIPVPGLFNTGIGLNGALLPFAADDPHYELVAQPGSGLTDLAVDALPAWLPNNSNSRWLTVENYNGPPGDYTYRTTFDLTGFDPTFASLSGLLAADNNATSVKLNGTSLNIGPSGFGSFTPFTFTTGFVAGVNTLEFVVNNGGAGPNPTGLRVEALQASARLLTDQRGLARYADGGIFAAGDSEGPRIDIGAYEAQAAPPLLLGDYNRNNTVDAADYTVYRDTLSQPSAFFAGADGNGDGVITTADYSVWVNNFGATLPPASSAAVSAAIPVAIPTSVAPVTSATNTARRDALPPLTRGAHDALLLAARQAAFAELAEEEAGSGQPAEGSKHNSRGATHRGARAGAPTTLSEKLVARRWRS